MLTELGQQQTRRDDWMGANQGRLRRVGANSGNSSTVFPQSWPSLAEPQNVSRIKKDSDTELRETEEISR